MSRELDHDDLDLTCNVAWRIAESDNGDVETIVEVTSEHMPSGMTEAVQAWIEGTCDGVDWVVARPRNPKHKPAAECVGEPSARGAQGASQPPAALRRT